MGTTVPELLAPRQVLTGKDDEPYAILTDLGWSIVGSSTPCLDETQSSLCHRVTVKELLPITPMDVISVLESDFKDTKRDDKTVSQENLVFLGKLKEGIQQNEQGHYEMPLPFKQRPHLAYLTGNSLKSGSVIYDESSTEMKNIRGTTQIHERNHRQR